MQRPDTRLCEECGADISAKKVTARYCSDRCRAISWRRRRATALQRFENALREMEAAVKEVYEKVTR